MYFRLHYDLDVKGQNLDSPLIFEPKTTHLFKIVIRTRTEEDLVRDPMNRHILEAHFKTALSSKHEACLTLIHQNVVEPKEKGEFFRYRKSDGSIVQYPQIHSDIIPSGFANTISELRNKFDIEGRKFISVLRWRLDQSYRDHDISPSRYQFSLNQKNWYLVPKGGPDVRLVGWSFVPAHPLAETIKEEILSFYDKSDASGEPFYHPLFRDAWSQQEDNPHSAIVMGIATIESAIKHCISQLKPEIEWFLEEMNTPPIDAMLSRYLPQLVTKTHDRRPATVPDKLRKIVKKGVNARNKIVHTGVIPDTKGFKLYHQDLKGATEELLLSVKDLLWLFDYYQGNPWAISYIRPETLGMIQK